MRRSAFSLLLPLALVSTPPSAVADDAAAAAEESADGPAWSGQVGLSYLATGGNSDTETLGLDLEAARRPAPWGLELSLQFHRAEQDGDKTAERYHAGLRGTRTLSERWQAFVGLSAEQDEFAGIDLRGVVEAGAGYKVLFGPRHNLKLDFALTWTDEQRLAPEADDSWIGALAGLDYELAISDSASLSQRLRYYPNFDASSDWRLDSLTALTAALKQRLALRLSQELRYRNRPLGDNDDTDSTTKASLVWSL